MNQILIYLFLILVLSSYSLSSQNIKCDKNSNELELFIKSLKKQNYRITTTKDSKNEIKFNSNQSNQLQLQFNNVKYYQAKCKKVLKDKMFVRFNIYEICFNNVEQSIFYENKINKIINGNDIYNEKFYDFVVRNKNQLIYISTNARVFYESVLEHNNELVKIIEK